MANHQGKPSIGSSTSFVFLELHLKLESLVQYGYESSIHKQYGLLLAKFGENGEWGTVCSDYFTEREAHVTCRTLNPDAKTVTSFKKTSWYTIFRAENRTTIVHLLFRRLIPRTRHSQGGRKNGTTWLFFRNCC